MKLYNRFSDNQLKVKEDKCCILKIKKDPATIKVEIININTTEKLPGTAVDFNLNFNKHLGGISK